MKPTPGNLKALLEEWQRVHAKEDEASKNIPQFQYTDDGEGEPISGLNPAYTKAREKIWNKGAKELHPLAEELDAQDQNAEISNDINDRAKYEALRRLLNNK